MFVLRLFEQHAMAKPIDARLLRNGTIAIGRDPATDWVLHDPQSRISRRHCEIVADGASIGICCLGTNGVFDDRTGERLANGALNTLAVPATLSMGGFVLVIDHAAQGHSDDSADSQTLILAPPLGSSTDVPDDYLDNGISTPQGHYGTSLLDCFCEGAGLEPSALALESPEDIMRRAGAVYRQMVLGVGDLMAEREAKRRQYQIARTTIGGADNNPFKWAPTQRLALDLLLAESHGFMSGPGALNASFKDIKRHLFATFRALRDSLRTTVSTFDPVAIDRETPSRGSLLQSRSAQLWAEVERRHAQLAEQLDAGVDGSLNQVFVRAYDAASSEIETSA